MEGSVLTAWQQFPDCHHPSRVYCRRVFSNGAEHYGTQCLTCGLFISVKKDSVPSLERKNPRDFDPEISKRYDARRSEFYRKQQEQREEERRLAFAMQQEAFRSRYTTYLNSEAWKRKRAFRMRANEKLFNGYCEICFENKANHCHHITYDRLGEEWIFDLAAICRPCHEKLHPHMAKEE